MRGSLRRGIVGLLCSDHAQPPHEIPDRLSVSASASSHGGREVNFVIQGKTSLAFSTLIQLAWLWVRHQPRSALTLWFEERVKRNGGRLKKSTIGAQSRIPSLGNPLLAIDSSALPRSWREARIRGDLSPVVEVSEEPLRPKGCRRTRARCP